jgi:phage tail-like protein
MALLGALGVRLDPLGSYNFVISLLDTSSTLAVVRSVAATAIADAVLGGFSECTGLDIALDVEEYREGGRNGEVLLFPTRVTWPHITLKKGMGLGTGLWDWHYGFAEGRGKRRDGVIALLDDRKVPGRIWYFRRGLPVKYSGPSLNAGQSGIAVESIEIAHEGIYQPPYVSAAPTAGALLGL